MAARKNIEWDFELLGLENDRVIAERLGCSPTAVIYQRRKRGIAACSEHRGSPGHIKWDDVVDLGVSTDREIADRFGVPIHNVRQARRARGMAAGWRDRSSERARALELRAEGWKLADIADVFEISLSTVCKWLREERWR